MSSVLFYKIYVTNSISQPGFFRLGLCLLLLNGGITIFRIFDICRIFSEWHTIGWVTQKSFFGCLLCGVVVVQGSNPVDLLLSGCHRSTSVVDGFIRRVFPDIPWVFKCNHRIGSGVHKVTVQIYFVCSFPCMISFPVRQIGHILRKKETTTTTAGHSS